MTFAHEQAAFLDIKGRGLDVAIDPARGMDFRLAGSDNVAPNGSFDNERANGNLGDYVPRFADDELARAFDFSIKFAVHLQYALKGDDPVGNHIFAQQKTKIGVAKLFINFVFKAGAFETAAAQFFYDPVETFPGLPVIDALGIFVLDETVLL